MAQNNYFIDSHCHVHFNVQDTTIDERINNAIDNNVKKMLCISVDEDDYNQVKTLAENYSFIYAAAGIHPVHSPGVIQSVEGLLDYCQDSKLIAVGETGLDYFHIKDDVQWQKDRFINHIKTAIELKKPLIIHTRDAMADTLSILDANHAEKCRGIMHCFTGDWQECKRALDLDFMISFSGILTYNSAHSLREVAAKVPMDRILVETDSPYLAPVPHRGKRNQPAYVINTAEKLAEIKNCSIDEIAIATTANFYDLFPHLSE